MSSFLRISAVAALFVTLAGAVPARADTIAGWDFSPIISGGNWGDSPMTPTTTGPNAAIGGITRGWTLGGGTSAAAAWGGNGFSTTAASETAGIAANDFATFSVTANAGYALSLSDIAAYNIRRSATGPSAGIWQYEVGGASFVDIESSPIAWGSVTTSSGNAQSAISLSGIADLQNVPAGTTVTFRCVTWGASGGTGTWYFNDPAKTTANDLVVEGTLAPAQQTPEPGTLALLALGGACAMLLTCSRKRGGK